MKNYPVKGNNPFHNVLLQAKSNWYLFVISLLVFLSLAYAYNTYAIKQYLISSTMLLQEHPNSPDASSQFSNGGASSVLNITDNIKNEADVLRSRSLMSEVVKKMHLNIQVFKDDGLLQTELYEEAPFEIKMLKYKVDSVKRQEYTVTVINNNTIKVVNEDEDLNRTLAFGKKLNLPQYNMEITRRPNVPVVKQQYSVKVMSEDDAINSLTNGYDAEFTDKATTNIEFTLYYPNSKKGEAILQQMMQQYLTDNINQKRRAIDSTINFINTRIAVVGSELNTIEKDYQQYRSNNAITDIDEQSKVLVNDASRNTDRYQQQQIQLSVINDLKQRLNDPSNKEAIPSSSSIQNASFASGLTQYNNLLNERERDKLSYTETNPVIQNLDQQIKVARRSLLQSIDNYQKEMQLSTNGLNSQNNAISGIIKNVPDKQRAIISFARQQELKQQLYVYLLQKREETAMAKAADMPYSRIVDNAKSTKEPAKPIKPIIYVMSFFLGLIVPFGYVNSKNMLGSKIRSEADIESQTDVVIIGKIGHVALPANFMVSEGSTSPVTESFRTLRTKLGNILIKGESNVIMVTSSVKGEGKTFLTGNLGSTLAMSGKKVVLLELDLRKPRLSNMLEMDHGRRGFSDYVMKGLPIDDIIKPTSFSKNCSLISSGPVVANASELLLSHKLGELITELRTRFDYILIDSSPVGLVSDALVIQKHADMTIYVCRHNFTNKTQIEIINDIKEKDSVENVYVVINDVDFSRAGYFGYGYGVGYGD